MNQVLRRRRPWGFRSRSAPLPARCQIETAGGPAGTAGVFMVGTAAFLRWVAGPCFLISFRGSFRLSASGFTRVPHEEELASV